MTAGTFLKALCRSFSDGIVLACTLTIIARNLGRMFKSFNSLFFPPIISEKGLHKPGEGLCSPFHYFGTDTPSNVKHWAGGGNAVPSYYITINLDRKVGQPVRLSFHLMPKLQ